MARRLADTNEPEASGLERSDSDGFFRWSPIARADRGRSLLSLGARRPPARARCGILAPGDRATETQTVKQDWHEHEKTLPKGHPECDPRRPDPRHPGGHTAAPFYRYLGRGGRKPRLRAVLESEAAKLVPHVPGGATRHCPGGRP